MDGDRRDDGRSHTSGARFDLPRYEKPRLPLERQLVLLSDDGKKEMTARLTGRWGFAKERLRAVLELTLTDAGTGKTKIFLGATDIKVGPEGSGLTLVFPSPAANEIVQEAPKNHRLKRSKLPHLTNISRFT